MKGTFNKDSSQCNVNLPANFHTAPHNYDYKIESFNAKFHIIKLIHPDIYTYTNKRIETVWGFIHKKTKEIHIPVNAKTPSNETILLEQTRPYTSMPLKLNPLESAFV